MKKKLLGLVYLLILLVSFYALFVSWVEVGAKYDIMGDAALFDGFNGNVTDQFEISDLLVVNASVHHGEVFHLSIFDKTGEVYSDSGWVKDGRAIANVPLYPSVFCAGNTYGFDLTVYAHNFPVPGAVLSDERVGVFTVEQVKSYLKLEGNDSEDMGLRLWAHVSNEDEIPIRNETVMFSLQFCWNDSRLADQGWGPLGEGVTDENGTAFFGLAYNFRGGCHRVRAFFGGDGNFTESFDYFCFRVPFVQPFVYFSNICAVSGGTNVVLKVTDSDGRPLSGKTVALTLEGKKPSYSSTTADGSATVCFPQETGLGVMEGMDALQRASVTVLGDAFSSSFVGLINMSNPPQPKQSFSDAQAGGILTDQTVENIAVWSNVSQFFGLLCARIEARFETFNSSLYAVNMTFWLHYSGVGDELLESVLVFGQEHVYANGTHYWVYDTPFDWNPSKPEQAGTHRLYVKAFDADGNLFAEGNMTVVVLSCPTSLTVSWLPASVGDTFNLTLGFATPTKFESEEVSEFFSRYRLSEKFLYDGCNYSVEMGYASKFNITLNNQQLPLVYSDDWGTAYVALNCTSDMTLNLTVVGSTVESLFLQRTETRIFNVSRMRLCDSAFYSDPSYEVNYTLPNMDCINYTLPNNDTAKRVYTTVGTPVNVNPLLYNATIANMPVSVVTAKLGIRTYVDNLNWMKHWNISGYKYLRAVYYYYANTSTGFPWTDINQDGRINMRDVGLVAAAFGKRVNDSDWYKGDLCDVNCDGTVDMKDIGNVTVSVNLHVDHRLLDIQSGHVYVFFYNARGENVGEGYLDSRGCKAIPQSASTMQISYDPNFGLALELYSSYSESQSVTDRCGSFCSSLIPNAFGTYLVRICTGANGEAYVDYAGSSLPDEIKDHVVEAFNVYAIRSPVNITLNSDPADPTIEDHIRLEATATNAVTGTPIEGLNVNFYEGSTYLGSDYTNGTGIAEIPFFTVQTFAYNFLALTATDNSYWNSSGSLLVDLRRPTLFRVWHDGDEQEISNFGSVEDLEANAQNSFRVELYVEYLYDYPNPPGEPVDCSYNVAVSKKDYLNETSAVLHLFSWPFQWYNNSCYKVYNDTGYFVWSSPASNSSYVFNFSYAGNECSLPCNFTFLGKVSDAAYKIYFAVPDSFEANHNVNLAARVFYANTDLPITSGIRIKFIKDGDVNNPVWNGMTYGDWQNISMLYPDGAHTLTVQAYGSDGSLLRFMTEPVQYEVYTGTKLQWDVTYDNATSEHVFTGRLLKSDGNPLNGQPVKLFLNDTQVTTLTTVNGYIEFRRHFDPGNESDTYNVQVTFDGTNGQSATQNATALDGSSYTVCTVTYFQYKPAANITTVTIKPHAAEVVVPIKSSEEAQQDAKNKGWFDILEQFGWWYPFHRTVFRIFVGETTIEAGISLLPGGETFSSVGQDVFNDLQEASITSFITEAATLMGEYLAAKVGFWIAPWISAIALGVEALEEISSMALQWNEQGQMLALGIVNILMGLVAIQGGFATAFLNLLVGVSAPAMAALTLLATGTIAAGGPILRTPVDWGEVALTFGFAALALAHWRGLI